MNISLIFCIILFFMIRFRFTSYACPEFLFQMIEFKNRLVHNSHNVFDDLSVNECGKRCIETLNCDSFSYNINSDPTKCYIFDQRVYSGQNSTNIEGLVTYWRLANTCPDDYNYNHTYNVCFKTFLNSADLKNWNDALKRCQDDGGYLFIPSTAEKFEFIVDTLNETMNVRFDFTFLGATDVVVADKWEWFNGISITSWRNGDPNNGGGREDCAAFLWGVGEEAQVVDVQCDELKTFVCELPMPPL